MDELIERIDESEPDARVNVGQLFPYLSIQQSTKRVPAAAIQFVVWMTSHLGGSSLALWLSSVDKQNQKQMRIEGQVGTDNYVTRADGQ